MTQDILTNNGGNPGDFFGGAGGDSRVNSTGVSLAPRPSLPPSAAQNAADSATEKALARAVQSMRWAERWDKYGITVICIGGGGALGHAFCIAQAAALVAGGPVLGHGVGIVAAPIVAMVTKIVAERVKPPKDNNERKQRLRGAFVLAVSGVVVAAASHFYDARYHYFLPEPSGSYGRAFKHLTGNQQDHIRHQILSFYLPNQTAQHRQKIKKQADQSGKPVEAFLFDRDGLGILDQCKSIQKEQTIGQRIAHFVGLD